MLHCHYRNDVFRDKLKRLEKDGFIGIDREEEVIYDSWGIGIKMNIDSFFICYSPLEGNREKNRRAAEYLPESFNKELLYLDVQEAVKKYEAPDPCKKGNYEELEEALKSCSGEHIVWPAGYPGIFERGSAILGFEQYMMKSCPPTKHRRRTSGENY